MPRANRTTPAAPAEWRRGEQLTAAYLRGLGYLVVARNFRTRRAEVDIVAEEANELVFVEVKSWRRTPSAAGEHAIDTRKRARIAGAARSFVARRPQFRNHRCRFDVVLVRSAGPPYHLRGAFES